jgi:hypothetical protein
MTDEQANDSATAWKTFLESSPPNTKLQIAKLAVSGHTGHTGYQHLPKVRLQMHCTIDGGVRWFELRGENVLSDEWDFEYNFPSPTRKHRRSRRTSPPTCANRPTPSCRRRLKAGGRHSHCCLSQCATASESRPVGSYAHQLVAKQ